MSIFAEYLAWAIVILTLVGFMVMGAGGFYYYTSVDASSSKKSMAIMMGFLCTILAIVFSVLLWCGWSHVKLAIEMVNASADFLA
jgi:hypothetical protein